MSKHIKFTHSVNKYFPSIHSVSSTRHRGVHRADTILLERTALSQGGFSIQPQRSRPWV